MGFVRFVAGWAAVLSFATVVSATPPIRPGEIKPWAATMPAMPKDIARKLEAFRQVAASDQAVKSASGGAFVGAVSSVKNKEELRPVFAELVAESKKAAKANPREPWRQLNLAYLTMIVGLKCVGRNIPDSLARTDEQSVKQYFTDRQAKMKVVEQTMAAVMTVVEQGAALDQSLAAEMVTSAAPMTIMLLGALDDPGPLCDRLAKAIPAVRQMKSGRPEVRKRTVKFLEDGLSASRQRGRQKKAMLTLLGRLAEACRKNDPSVLDKGTKEGGAILDKARRTGRKIADLLPVRVNPWSKDSGKIDLVVRYEPVAGRKDDYRLGYVVIYRQAEQWVITKSNSY